MQRPELLENVLVTARRSPLHSPRYTGRRASTPPRSRRWALLTVAALLLSGCAAGAEATPTTTPTALPEGVTVEVVQLRADVAVRQAQVHLVNGSDEPLEIGDVKVDDPRFAAPATRVLAGRTSTIAPGGELNVRVQLPDVSCPADSAGEAAPTVELELLSGEEPKTVRVPAADPLGFLAPLHERECRAEALAAAADLTFTAFIASAPGAPATLQLTIAPTGEGAATVDAVQATNLLSFGPATVDGTYPVGVEVTPDAPEPVVVGIPILPSRCDPHAVQEDKRGTIFDIRLALDGEPGEIELFVGDDMRGKILTWVADWCGFGA